MENSKQKIVLTGFMGVGKSSVARHLAYLLGCGQVDLDDYIVEQEKQEIVRILQTVGEPQFRRIETENLRRLLQILAIFGTRLEGGLEIRDAAELRVKESDRIAATVENLRRMDAKVEEFPDGFKIYQSNLKGATVESFGDHRIAMAFSIAALFADGETEIIGAECAAVSFPEFYEVLSRIVNRKIK